MQSGFINHLDLTVSDMDLSCAFYDKVLGRLGFSQSNEYQGDVPSWELREKDSAMSIGLHKARSVTRHDRNSAGLHHLAFHLSSRGSVDNFYDFLIREQVQILDPPAEYDYTPGYYALFFTDPDGIKLELVYEPRFERTAV